MTIRSGFLICVSPVVLVALTGCGVAPQEIDDLATTREPITSSSEYVDSTGKVHTIIYQCDWVPSAEHPHATCAVDSNTYVLVGGGAEIEETGYGALLTGSYPCNNDLMSWCADSKDHHYVASHRLRAYAIGMRIDGYSAAILRQNYMRITTQASAQSNRPSATVLPYWQNYVGYYTMLGGGARTYDYGAGILLTDSEPVSTSNGMGWTAAGKDHIDADTGKVMVYGISIAPGIVTNSFNHVSSGTSTGYTSIGFYSTAAQWLTGMVPTSLGANSHYSGAGRLLTSIDARGKFAPYYSNFMYAQSKDHGIVSSGSVDSFVAFIRGI